MGAPEIWMLSFPPPEAVVPLARQAEADGWDGLLVADSQNLTGDVYAMLAAAALATTRLGLAPGVTNPATRHAAVTASAIATVQLYSGGRAVLGIGRGDSALGYLGQPPAPPRVLERYLAQVQGYLRGEAVDLDGYASRLEWLARAELPKVPVDVAATGPRVIALGARHAERVTFAVGADPARLGWAIATAREARRAAGLDPATLSLGAYVNAVAHPDVAVARNLVRGSLGTLAHFSSMRGSSTAQLAAEDRAVFQRLGRAYDLAHHAMGDARHAAVVDDAFVDRFGVVGPVDYCIERLRALLALGLERLVIVGHSRDADPAELAAANARFAREVIPALKE